MYEMKTLLPQFDIKLPTCMYKMKNISLSAESVVHTKSQYQNGKVVSTNEHNNTEIFEATSVTAKISTVCPLDLEKLAQQIQRIVKMTNSQEPEIVIKRQEKLLNQLNDLKNQLAQIRSTLDMSNNSDKVQENKALHVDNKLTGETMSSHDIVVHANPKLIPYSLLVLQHLWKDIYSIEFKIFKHSTIRELTADAIAFEKVVLKSPSYQNINNKPRLCITLVWKECIHTEMINSLGMFAPIYGEVNILRYLARIGPNAYHYDDDNNDTLHCNEIDSLLDMCHILIHNRRNSRIRVDIIQKLQRQLRDREYFITETITIADIAVYSTLKGFKEITDKQLPPNILNWRKRMDQMIKI